MAKQGDRAYHEFWLVAKAHLAEYINKPLLNIGFVFSLAIATSTLLSILVLNHASKQQYQAANNQLKSPIAFTVVAKENGKITLDDFTQLRRQGFHQLKPIHLFRKTLAKGQTIKFRAIDMLPLVLMQPQNFSSKKINVNHKYAKSLNLIPAEQLELSPSLSTKKTLEVNLNNINEWGQVALLDITLAWEVFPDIQGFSHLMVTTMTEQEKSRLAGILPSHLIIQENWSIEEREGFADALHLNLSALAILGFIVSLFIAFQAANQAWTTRADLAIQLRLFGIKMRTIQNVMFCESLLLTLLASMIGVAFAFGLVTAILPLLGLTLEQIYHLSASGHFQWQWQYSLWAFAISAVAVVVALIQQFKIIASTHIALSTRAKNRPFNFKFTLITSVILLMAFALWPSNSWHQLMFKYGLLLMVSAMILPNLLRYILQGCAHFCRSFRLKYIFKDASQQVGRRFLPIAAFYLALTSSIAAALMVNSFQSSFIAYLDQLLNSEMFVSYNSEQKKKVVAWLPKQAEIDEYVHFQKTIGKMGDDTLDIYSATSQPQQASILLKEKAAIPLNEVTNPCYINEQLAYRRTIALRQNITIEQGMNRFSCQVIGIFYDYGSHGFSVKIPKYHQLSELSGWQDIGFGLFFKEGASFNKEKIINELSLDESQVFQPENIKQMALSVFDQTFVLTQAIAFVLLAIACFGLFLSAHSLELARKADLQILSSLGYSRFELFSHMLCQWFLLACAAVILSWPVAVVLADALVSLILPASFGWSMPLVIDIKSFAASSLIGLLLLIPALGMPLYKLNVRASLS